MKLLTKFAMLLLALLLAACTFDPGAIVFTFGYDLPQVDISFPVTVSPSETATISPTIVPSATPTLTPTVTNTPSETATFEPSPTRETLNRIRLNANTNIRTAPNGSVVRVAQSGSEFVVLSRMGGYSSGDGSSLLAVASMMCRCLSRWAVVSRIILTGWLCLIGIICGRIWKRFSRQRF